MAKDFALLSDGARRADRSGEARFRSRVSRMRCRPVARQRLRGVPRLRLFAVRVTDDSQTFQWKRRDL